MTRVEVSVCVGALNRYNPFTPSVRTAWHTKAQNAMDLLASKVLNHDSARELVYRKMRISELLLRLACSDTNLLAIGKQNCWLINARTAHASRFVGVHQAISLSHT